MRLDHLLSRENQDRKTARGPPPPAPFASARGARPWGLAPGHLESRIAKKSGLKRNLQTTKTDLSDFHSRKVSGTSVPGARPERGEGVKGARRMPRHGEPTKGAGSRDSPGGAALRLRSRGARMGEPSRRGPAIPKGRATGGTETSKYPEEGKSTETPRVAASERGPAQTGASEKRARAAAPGLWARRPGGAPPGWSYKAPPGRNTHGKAGGTGLEPRTRRQVPPGRGPEYRRARETRREAGGTTLQG